MSKPRQILALLIGVIIILGVGLVAYYLGKQSSSPLSSNVIPSTTPSKVNQQIDSNIQHSVASSSNSSALAPIDNQQNSFSVSSNSEYWIKVLSPNGSKYYCMGDNIPIDWQTSPNIESVNIYLIARESSWLIGTYPSSYNESGKKNYSGEIIWKAGDIQAPHQPWGNGQGYFVLVQGWGAPGSLVGRINGINSVPFVMNDCSSG